MECETCFCRLQEQQLIVPSVLEEMGWSTIPDSVFQELSAELEPLRGATEVDPVSPVIRHRIQTAIESRIQLLIRNDVAQSITTKRPLRIISTVRTTVAQPLRSIVFPLMAGIFVFVVLHRITEIMI